MLHGVLSGAVEKIGERERFPGEFAGAAFMTESEG